MSEPTLTASSKRFGEDFLVACCGLVTCIVMGAYGMGHYATEYLVIHLADDTAETLDIDDGAIAVFTLADQILYYWKRSLHVCYKPPE